MKLEAVIVCKDYDDFLSHTLSENLQFFDRVVVVTHPDDQATQRLCDKFGVVCVTTDVMHQDGDKFNKGRAINYALNHLKHDGWLLHLDADILLPHNFRNLLGLQRLQEDCIYGVDRLRVKGFDHFMREKGAIVPQHRMGYLLTPHEAFPVGARLIHGDHGYCPIGYFQLWHGSQRKSYPVIAGSAAHSDVVFSLQWVREKRVLLPGFFVYHLESDPGAYVGTNWEGRKTPRFGASVDCAANTLRKYGPSS